MAFTQGSGSVENEASETTHFGFKTVARQDKESLVHGVFDQVAQRYDMMNDLMSGGLHRLWKDALVAWLAPPRHTPWRCIDVAGGTGDIAFRIAERAKGAHITVADINGEMLEVGRTRAADRALGDIEFVEADAQSLPFLDATYDAYTIAFGIRNVTDIEQALSDAYRVLRPGGRFVCLEFSQVTMPVLERVYDLYSFNVIPAMGRAVAGDAEPYRYLVESIRQFPNQEAFARLIEQTGFSRVRYRNLSGGVAALHSAWKI